MDIPELLGRSDLFGQFQPDALEAVAAASRLAVFDRNERVFAEGDPADELYVVRSGRVAIANRSPDGRESVMALMEPGDLFGDMSLFDGEGRSAEARALEASEVVLVPYSPVRELFETRPQLLWDVVAFLSRRLRATDSALADAVFLDVTGRTAKRLLELAGSQDEFVLPLTQE
ncbi:MAG TPA: Crp/Fnr family transcriptional regulator, partial [Acidimicrobiales bacterium]